MTIEQIKKALNRMDFTGYADVLGITQDELLVQLGHGIATQSKRVLDNLGIMLEDK